MLAALFGGLLLGGIAIEVATGDPDYMWMLSVPLPLFIISLILLGIAKGLRGANLVPDKALQELLDQRQGALARIKQIRRTGTSINDNPVCELTVVVAPEDRDAYTTTTRLLIDQIDVLRYQPGTVVVVARPDRDHPKALLVRNPDPTWQRRIAEEASRIPADHQAPEWVADAKSDSPLPGRKPIVPMGRSGRGLRIGIYVVMFAIGAAVFTVPNSSQFAWGLKSWTISNFDNYVDGDQQQAAVDALVEVVGGYEFIEILFYEGGYVIAEAPSEPGAATVDDFEYRYGLAEQTGPTLIQPQDPLGSLFDVRDVVPSAISSYAAKAVELTGIADSESTLVRVARAMAAPDAGQAPVEITVSLSNEYYSGWVGYDADGQITSMSGGVPGSQSYEAEHSSDLSHRVRIRVTASGLTTGILY